MCVEIILEKQQKLRGVVENLHGVAGNLRGVGSVCSLFFVVLLFSCFLNSPGYPQTAGNKNNNPATAEELFTIAQDSRQINAYLSYATGLGPKSRSKQVIRTSS